MTESILFLDIEATSPDPAKAKIISIALAAHKQSEEFVFNPGVPIPPETAVHGFTDDMVKDKPVFASKAEWILGAYLMKAKAIAGFNLLAFDLPVLWQHLYESGFEWGISTQRIIDVGLIFKFKEPRGLAAAVEFYCGRKHAEAHNAMADTLATRDVLIAQVDRYQDLGGMSIPDLAKFSRGDQERIDFAGKILRDADGDAVYGFGKSKGVKLKDDLGLAYWILDRDFAEQTKFCIRVEMKRIDEAAVAASDEHDSSEIPY